MFTQNSYSILNQQSYSKNEFSIAPIRYEDRELIMNWRNEQIYHLRQSKPLTIEDQDKYFNQVVSRLFTLPQPDQLLFSYLRNNTCIGYGGLVHINWIDQNAEISFIMNTSLEKSEFELHWSNWLEFIERVAFEDLKLHKLYVYAFDLRPHLYDALEHSGYIKDAVLKEHCFVHQKFKDVVIHSKWNTR